MLGPNLPANMDVAALRECIGSTLTANADVRRQAELQLKAVSRERGRARGFCPPKKKMRRLTCRFFSGNSQAEVQPGFVAALTDIVSADPDANLRLSGNLKHPVPPPIILSLPGHLAFPRGT